MKYIFLIAGIMLFANAILIFFNVKENMSLQKLREVVIVKDNVVIDREKKVIESTS